ncbi:MAG TPA: methyltransferase domain-containing protein [Candidatus Dormibacteraeota bacterium]|nr:methyltransferase domain-containing protein [Candidatus Dormibacteraeota bacterium]
MRHAELSYGNANDRAHGLYDEIRAEAFGTDIGQTGWLTVNELTAFVSWLGLGERSRVLDLACGAGGTLLRMIGLVGCRGAGVDEDGRAIREANEARKRMGLRGRAWFVVVESGARLPYHDASFDAVMCIDAIDHFPDRLLALTECRRVVKPGGRVLFTDPLIVSGPVSNEELAIRCLGRTSVVAPAGVDEACIADAGLELLWCEDTTASVAEISGRWHAARTTRAGSLRPLEGERAFEEHQQCLMLTEQLARERRISRIAYLAQRA